jgi:hypothetical protein
VKIGFIELTFLSKEDFQNDVIVEEKFIAEAPIVINYDSINRANQIILDSLNNLKVLKLKHIRDSIIFTEKNIQYPSNNPELLYRFFKKLDNAKFKKVRIMHYGDSQIEGDRISGRLRQRLQNEFGGKGPGLFAIIPATRKISLNNTPSKNWVRKTGFGPYIDKKVNHKKYGALFSFCKMVEDSTYIDSNFIFNGEITIKKPTKSYKLCKSFKKLKIYYSCE